MKKSWEIWRDCWKTRTEFLHKSKRSIIRKFKWWNLTWWCMRLFFKIQDCCEIWTRFSKFHSLWLKSGADLMKKRGVLRRIQFHFSWQNYPSFYLQTLLIFTNFWLTLPSKTSVYLMFKIALNSIINLLVLFVQKKRSQIHTMELRWSKSWVLWVFMKANVETHSS